jgi:hypothetical protein
VAQYPADRARTAAGANRRASVPSDDRPTKKHPPSEEAFFGDNPEPAAEGRQDSSGRKEEDSPRRRRGPMRRYDSEGYGKTRESYPLVRFLVTQCAQRTRFSCSISHWHVLSIRLPQLRETLQAIYFIAWCKLNSVPPTPSSTTSPEISQPKISGNGDSPIKPVRYPALIPVSTGLIPPRTRTSTSPAPGTGRFTSS